MKTVQKKQKRTKKVATIIIGAVLLLTAISLIFVVFVYPKIKSIQQNNEALKSIDTDQNSDTPETSTSGSDNVNDPKTTIPTDPGTQAASIEAPSITRAESNSKGQIRVSAIFSQPAYGSCSITFARSGQESVVRSATVIIQASYYACNGFLIPISDFPAKGEWKFSVTHEYSNMRASTEEQAILVE